MSHYTTREEKMEVIDLLSQGCSFGEIAKRTRFSRSGASMVIKAWDKK
jgi:DNA-binding NarL/FixJ family response regulator